MSIPAIEEEKYKDKPFDLFPLARQYLTKKQYEEGIGVLEKAIYLAIAKYGSETDIGVAKYFDEYASALITKLLDNDEVLVIPQQEFGQKEKENSAKNNSNETKDKKEEELNESKKEDDQEKDESPLEDSDEKIAHENLTAANIIYTTFLKQYDNEEVGKLPEEIKKYYLDLADNYYNFGELERARSDYEAASRYYKKCIEVRKKYDDKFSRAIAEAYYTEAAVLDTDAKGCLLCNYKTKVIMEYHLNLALKAAGSNIVLVIDEKDLDLTSISEKDPKIFQNRQILESNEIKELCKTHEKVEDFVGIISDLYLKLEDVILEITEFDKYIAEKKKMEKSENKFTENYDKSKVVDISKSSIIRKKRQIIPGKEDEIISVPKLAKFEEPEKQEENPQK